MKEPKVSDIKKYLNGLLKLNKKYVTSERLSKVVGIYPDIINEHLSYFEPLLAMDTEFNLMELVPTLKKYLVDQEENKTLIKKPAIKKAEVEQQAYEIKKEFKENPYNHERRARRRTINSEAREEIARENRKSNQEKAELENMNDENKE